MEIIKNIILFPLFFFIFAIAAIGEAIEKGFKSFKDIR